MTFKVYVDHCENNNVWQAYIKSCRAYFSHGNRDYYIEPGGETERDPLWDLHESQNHVKLDNGYLVFESEEVFSWFMLRWL